MILKLEIKNELHKEIMHIDTRNIIGLTKSESEDMGGKLEVFYLLDLTHRQIKITEDKYYELLEVLYSNKF